MKTAGNFNMGDKSEECMEKIDEINANEQGQKKRLSGIKIFFLVIVIAVVTSILTVWLFTLYFFPKQFKPVELSKSESQSLSDKLDRLDPTARSKTDPAGKNGKALIPEKYSEDATSRHITFSERELNALLAKNTDLAEKLAIDLSNNLASAKLILPLDPDLPILGGKTLKLNAGLELWYKFVGCSNTKFLDRRH
jgi:cytoskeletal protein RodZ